MTHAVFVGIRFALVAVDGAQVARAAAAGDRRARWLLSALDRPEVSLSGARLGLSVTSIGLGFLLEPALAELLREPLSDVAGREVRHGIAVALALVVVTVVLVVAGELVPRALALGRPLGTARTLAPLARVVGAVLWPAARRGAVAATRLTRAAGVEPTESRSVLRRRAGLVRPVQTSAGPRVLDPDELAIIDRALRFGEKDLGDVLTPRIDVVWLAATATIAELAARSVDTGFSQFPVVGADLDDIVGVVHVKATFEVPPAQRRHVTVDAHMDAPCLVPASMPLDELLIELRTSGRSMAVVLDEYGGTAGIVTIEDLLEELVGEIDDEHDPARRATVEVPGGRSFVLSGGLHPDEVTEQCGLVVPDGAYETVAGFVLDRLGRIPDPGDAVELDGWRLEVSRKRGHRIVTLLVTPPEPAAEDRT